MISDQVANFSFNIKYYHNLIRYKILVLKQKDKITVKVEDKDYALKSAIYQYH